MSAVIDSRWSKALALDRRQAPEFYAVGSEVSAGAHAEAIRFALGELGLSAVSCINGVPTIGFLSDPLASIERIDELHRILWNQGLMSMLLVIRGDELTAYSLVQRPLYREENRGKDARLVKTLSLLDDALTLRELLDATESGRFWYENDGYFNPDNRVDSVLLANLLMAFRSLKDELGTDAAQALLMQTMFVAYLEDRQIIGEAVFRAASQGRFATLVELLGAGNTEPFEALFAWLHRAFNGNLFKAPCAFETEEDRPAKLKAEHLTVLARFRHGHENMATHQIRFWGYDFRYMSIGLISAVYDRFLKEEAEKKSADGAFYTPMFLADIVVNQLWDELTDEQKEHGVYCDPACGSGIFLVRLFQRLVAHHCQTKNKRHAAWIDLKAIANRLHGGDINASAVRVAAFSLYIALLEQSSPSDLPKLIEAGKLLPPLYGKTLLPGADFFAVEDARSFDVIIGNPPWNGRTGQLTTAQNWTTFKGYLMPAKDIAWGFVWKALEGIKPTGLVAFLLPAMGILHNTESRAARQMLLQRSRVRRIINMSDLCFQLFDGAQRPTAFVLYGGKKQEQEQAPYRFEYWVPKADLNLRLKRLVTLSRADRLSLRSDLAAEDSTLFKRRLWARAPEERLLQYLRTIPTLGSFIQEFKAFKRSKVEFNRDEHWVIGQGFQPAQESRLNDPEYPTTIAEIVTRLPYLDANKFEEVVIPRVKANPWPTSVVRRAGFDAGFIGPHILISQGVKRAVGRVRAAFSEQDVVFEHSLQAITVPPRQQRKAKVLTAVLNSSLAAWFYFHDTANLGTDRAKVHQGELLKLPFDDPENMPDPARALKAEKGLVALIDGQLAKVKELLTSQDDVLDAIDHLVFEYYGFDDSDVAIVEDTVHSIIPAMQPRRNAGLQSIWAPASSRQRSDYAAMLCSALSPHFRVPVSASLTAHSTDVAVLKLTIGDEFTPYTEDLPGEFNDFLGSITVKLPIDLPGNVQLIPDLRLVIDRDMYLVKPTALRHWLRSTALADAEQIAAEFVAAATRKEQKGAVRAGRQS
ncbi:type I endonuclease-methyltransferase fusion protein [Zoogloea oryzae]|uniref:site-specific DNA-methyltransferase (adenine-specific) n=1 Tax=Zoogloea oryzae TaxID=310767 RepID=A0ABQ6FA04_9RHOO|nr:N-6 DNA methylase [Zoogloea oryzae]GLT22124.1 type I endonuclease-methyltransferase fusion protein [Zoogloea oryzae]